MVELAAPQGKERVLDVGAGGGHAALALAPHVAWVTLTDPVPRMLTAAGELFAERGLANADFLQARAETLPFEAAAFDIVTCRLAAHHFSDVETATKEVARVLRPGGIYLMVDTLGPEDGELARFAHQAEFMRDPTHVRCYTKTEWIGLCERAGLKVDHLSTSRTTHAFEAWLGRGGADAVAQEEVRQRFLTASPAAVAEFEIVIENGVVMSFTDSKLVLRARK
jgi:ubiquinone/menaquinone biosynthesis C-methylase UbiE